MQITTFRLLTPCTLHDCLEAGMRYDFEHQGLKLGLGYGSPFRTSTRIRLSFS